MFLSCSSHLKDGKKGGKREQVRESSEGAPRGRREVRPMEGDFQSVCVHAEGEMEVILSAKCSADVVKCYYFVVNITRNGVNIQSVGLLACNNE